MIARNDCFIFLITTLIIPWIESNIYFLLFSLIVFSINNSLWFKIKKKPGNLFSLYLVGLDCSSNLPLLSSNYRSESALWRDYFISCIHICNFYRFYYSFFDFQLRWICSLGNFILWQFQIYQRTRWQGTHIFCKKIKKNLFQHPKIYCIKCRFWNLKQKWEKLNSSLNMRGGGTISDPSK